MRVSLLKIPKTFKQFNSLKITGVGPEVDLAEGGRATGLR